MRSVPDRMLPLPAWASCLQPVMVWLVPKRELEGGPADACGGLSPRRLFGVSRSCLLSP